MFRFRNYSLIKKLFLFLFAFYSLPLFGQECPLEKITAVDGKTWNRFGLSVSVGKQYAIVGAPFEDNELGSAYIYKYDGVTWKQQVELSGSIASEYRNFGISVYIDDEYAIVGTYSQSHVYVFKREGEAWIEKAILSGDNRSGNPFDSEAFGYALDMQGDLLIVGAYFEDTRGVLNAGAAYIFRREDTSGTKWVREAKLAPPGLASYDGYGYQVAISGNMAIVSALGDGRFGNNTPAGAAYIYEKKGNDWIQQAKLKTDKQSSSNLYAVDVDIYQDPQTGSRIAVVGDDSYGVHVYRFVNQTWKYDQFIGNELVPLSYRFGFSVSLQGNNLLVGQSYDSKTISGAGAAWLYRRTAGKFEFVQWFQAPDTHEQQNFGHSVGLSQDGTSLIIGAYNDQQKGYLSGAAYVKGKAQIQPVPVLCAKSESLSLSALPAGGSWQGSGVNSSTGVFNPATAGTGKHKIIYTYSGVACLLRDTLEIEVRDRPVEVAIEYASSLQLCAQNSIELIATDIEGQQYVWQYSPTVNGTYTDAPGENFFSYYQADKGGYYRVSYGLQGCTFMTTAPVYVEPVQMSISTTSVRFCRGETVSLSVSGTAGLSYQWEYALQRNDPFMPASGENRQANYLTVSEGYYRVVATLYGCELISDTIEVREAFTEVSINPTLAVCQDRSPFQLSGFPEGGTWSGTGISSAGIFDPFQAGAGNHSLTYLVTTTYGCTYSSSTIIEVKSLPQVEVLGNPVIPFCANSGAAVSVTAIPQADYNWEYMPSAGGIFQPMQASSGSSISASKAGFYRAKVNQAGCVAYSLPVEVVAIKDSTEFPNVFTPNGDGVNDTFELIVENADHYQLEIYNRLGRRVFASSGTTSQWDGKGFPTGVYFWQIRYNTVCDKEMKILKGVVSILY